MKKALTSPLVSSHVAKSPNPMEVTRSDPHIRFDNSGVLTESLTFWPTFWMVFSIYKPTSWGYPHLWKLLVFKHMSWHVFRHSIRHSSSHSPRRTVKGLNPDCWIYNTSRVDGSIAQQNTENSGALIMVNSRKIQVDWADHSTTISLMCHFLMLF